MCSLKGQLTLEPFFTMDFLGLCFVSQWKANNCIFIFSKADSSAHRKKLVNRFICAENA